MLERLKEVLAKVLPDTDMSGVTEETKLAEDLGFDSLAMMMMAMEIEDSFGFRFTEFVKFDTVGDVCRYIEEKTK
ncbi:MAG: acyl carrier protein [Clostridia bacterium]|nr:acyl carrier protein [Clostridia bacterium]